MSTGAGAAWAVLAAGAAAPLGGAGVRHVRGCPEQQRLPALLPLTSIGRCSVPIGWQEKMDLGNRRSSLEAAVAALKSWAGATRRPASSG